MKYVIRESKFIGYNDTLPSEQLPSGVLAVAKNCFCESGEIVKRTGYSLIGNDLGAKPGQGIKGVRFADGTLELLGIFNGLIYKWTGTGNWSALTGTYTLNTTGLIDIVVANNAVYFFDGTNTVVKYNGTTCSTVANIPIGKYAKWFVNQLHVAGISGDPNALKSSVAGDPETFTGGISSDLDVNANDGDEITALAVFNNELYIFKRNRVWSASGFGTDALAITDINERLSGVGTFSHFAIVNTGNDLLYPSFMGDRPIIRSLRKTWYNTVVDGGEISEGIKGTLDGINKNTLTIASGLFDGVYAWFNFCNGSAAANNLTLTLQASTVDAKHKGWTQHTGIPAACMDNFAISGTTAKLYFLNSGADSTGFVMDTSTDDNGAAIAFEVRSRRYGGEMSEIKKKWKWIWMWAKEVGNYDVTIDYAVDGFDFDNAGTINLSGTGSTLDTMILDTSRLGSTDIKKQRYTFPKRKGHYLQLKVYDSSSTSSVTIRNWELVFYRKAPVEE